MDKKALSEWFLVVDAIAAHNEKWGLENEFFRAWYDSLAEATGRRTLFS